MGKIFIIFIVIKKYPDGAGRFLAQKCLFISYANVDFIVRNIFCL